MKGEVRMDARYKELKQEFSRPSFRAYLKAELGTKCRVCGADVAEYHHIVPLSLDGDNRISNIIPLCNVCHSAAHGGRELYKRGAIGGRPKAIPPKDYENILDGYAKGLYGKKECHRLAMMDDLPDPCEDIEN